VIECPVNHPALPALFDPMIPDHPALWAVLKERHTGRAMVDNEEHPTQCVLRTDAALTYSPASARVARKLGFRQERPYQVLEYRHLI
jgi:hypothetical protein